MSNNNQNIKITVSGIDCTEKLGGELSAAVQEHYDEKLNTRIERERPVLELRDSAVESSYLELHAQLLRYRNTVDPADFNHLPASAPTNIKGRIVNYVQKALWKLLHYQHDWMAFRNNTIITQLTYQLEFERNARKQLEAEVTDIEKKVNHALLSLRKQGDDNV